MSLTEMGIKEFGQSWKSTHGINYPKFVKDLRGFSQKKFPVPRQREARQESQYFPFESSFPRNLSRLKQYMHIEMVTFHNFDTNLIIMRKL